MENTHTYFSRFYNIKRCLIIVAILFYSTAAALAATAPITGASSVCVGANTTLSDATAGGVWMSSNPAVGTIGSASGIVGGISAGTTTITYTASGGAVTKTITVNALPGVPGITIGSGQVCVGSTITLGESTSGGTHFWSSADLAVAVINSSTGIVTGITEGTATISYRYTLGCTNYAMTTITVNPTSIPDITGTLSLCAYGNTTTLSGTPEGGTWQSSAPAKAAIDEDGIVTSGTVGTSRITYSLPNGHGCIGRTVAIFTTNPVPSVNSIGGLSSVCIGSGITLTDATPGGEWRSSNEGVAEIDGSGVISTVTVGTTTISYTVTNSFGCVTTKMKVVSVNPLPTVPDIDAGSGTVCLGSTLLLHESTIGGTHFWFSEDTLIATVGPYNGSVRGMSTGTVTISYKYTLGCTDYATTVLTVDPIASVAGITGPGSVEVGSSISLSDATSGGIWTSGNNAVATVNSAGSVTGVTAGLVNITYTVFHCGVASISKLISVTTPRGGNMTTATGDKNIVQVYPNPTSGALYIKTNGPGVFTVFTLEGKEIERYNVNDNVTSIDLPKGLARGVYMCRFYGNDGSSAMLTLMYEQ